MPNLNEPEYVPATPMCNDGSESLLDSGETQSHPDPGNRPVQPPTTKLRFNLMINERDIGFFAFLKCDFVQYDPGHNFTLTYL